MKRETVIMAGTETRDRNSDKYMQQHLQYYIRRYRQGGRPLRSNNLTTTAICCQLPMDPALSKISLASHCNQPTDVAGLPVTEIPVYKIGPSLGYFIYLTFYNYSVYINKIRQLQCFLKNIWHVYLR